MKLKFIEWEYLLPSDCLAGGSYTMNKENAAIWVIPQRPNSDAGELPYKHTTFRTWRKSEIKKNASTLPSTNLISLAHIRLGHPIHPSSMLFQCVSVSADC